MHVYDITVGPEAARRDDSREAGWCFGLPPGLRPQHWPLDPGNGYPLVHGFTVLIPDEYRCHGPDIVALSLFGTPQDMDIGEGGPFIDEGIVSMFTADAIRPSDPDLEVFWRAARNEHPRLYRIRGGWDASYAVVLLTRDEFDGALCRPPEILPNRRRDKIDPPLWLQLGAAAAAVNLATGDTRLLRLVGDEPEPDVGFNRVLRLVKRPGDPNAGKAPLSCDLDQSNGHQAGYHEGPVCNTNWNHFGGTMRAGQNIPPFGPRYIEFEQYMGGFNFADGTAQLDLQTMAFNVMTT